MDYNYFSSIKGVYIPQMTFINRKFYLFFLAFFLPVLFTGIFYIFEYGLFFDSWNKLVNPLVLSLITVTMIVKKNLKRFVFIFSIICLIAMVFIYLFNLIDVSQMVGDFGFSLLLITIILYIPRIIKEGHLEKF